jgi:hypothetical protein
MSEGIALRPKLIAMWLVLLLGVGCRDTNPWGANAHPAPLAWRFHRIPGRSPLKLHTIWWKLCTDGPAD